MQWYLHGIWKNLHWKSSPMPCSSNTDQWSLQRCYKVLVHKALQICVQLRQVKYPDCSIWRRGACWSSLSPEREVRDQKGRSRPLGLVKKLSTAPLSIVNKEAIWPAKRGVCNKGYFITGARLWGLVFGFWCINKSQFTLLTNPRLEGFKLVTFVALKICRGKESCLESSKELQSASVWRMSMECWRDMTTAEILAVLNTRCAAKLFHVNTGKDPAFSYIEVHLNCNNCSHEIAAFIYSSSALSLNCEIKIRQVAIQVWMESSY